MNSTGKPRRIDMGMPYKGDALLRLDMFLVQPARALAGVFP